MFASVKNVAELEGESVACLPPVEMFLVDFAARLALAKRRWKLVCSQHAFSAA
jgi:hypothetical protein